MKKVFAVMIALCMTTAVFLGGAAESKAEAELFLCKPVTMSAVYNPDTEKVECCGSYTGWLQTERTYSIMVVDANGTIITALSPRGTELDRGNCMFEYSFTLTKSVYNSCALPLRATLSCLSQEHVIKPISATVELPMLGDVNHDGKVDNMDAARVLIYDSGQLDKIDFAAADVNSDGHADNLDAAAILKYDSGLIQDFRN